LKNSEIELTLNIGLNPKKYVEKFHFILINLLFQYQIVFGIEILDLSRDRFLILQTAGGRSYAHRDI